MALKLGVKSTIEQKLLRRQRNCYAQLKATNPYTLKDARKQDVKECSVFASKHVCVKSSAELGRFVQVTLHTPVTIITGQYCCYLEQSTVFDSTHGTMLLAKLPKGQVLFQYALLQTTKAVEAGKVLATESPFASQLDEQFKLTHCGYCFREAASIIP